MRGVVFKGDCQLEIMKFDDPVPGPGEVVVEMKASGLCGSDLHFYRNNPAEVIASLGLKDLASRGIDPSAPIIAGHEPCGVVREVGQGVDPKSFRVGDRVAVFHYSGCSHCPSCRSGWAQMCEEGAMVYGAVGHGGHADYLKVPASSLVHLPQDVSFLAGAAISCGTGSAYGGLVRLGITARDQLAVFGLGPVGLSAAQLASAMGIEVIGVDISADRVERSREFGVTHALDGSKVDVVSEIHKLTRGRGVSCAMDCAGGEVVRSQAIRSTAPWGRVVLLAVGGNINIDAIKDLISKQRTIIGSYTFSINIMEELTRFVADHGIEVDRIFTDLWPLDSAEQAYAAFNKQGGGKAAFVFS